MRKKRLWLGVAAMVGMLALSGCGKQFDVGESDSAALAEDNRIVVGVSQIGSESVWRTANTNSIQRAFTQENGYLMIFNNARQKQENQIKAIRSFISQQVDYIVFSPITENGWDTVLQEAQDSGIPIILMDRQLKTADESLYTAWVGSNFEQEGVLAGNWLDGYLKEKGREEEPVRIVVLQGTAGATSVIGRTEGFHSVAREHANWEILEETDAEYTTAKGHEVMEKMLSSYDTIDVVVSQNDDMTFGAVEAIKNAGKTTGTEGDIIIISFDACRAALEMVQNGVINVDIECNPEQGEAIAKVIEALERGETVDKKCYIEEKVFTPDNVGEYIESRSY